MARPKRNLLFVHRSQDNSTNNLPDYLKEYKEYQVITKDPSDFHFDLEENKADIIMLDYQSADDINRFEILRTFKRQSNDKGIPVFVFNAPNEMGKNDWLAHIDLGVIGFIGAEARQDAIKNEIDTHFGHTPDSSFF